MSKITPEGEVKKMIKEELLLLGCIEAKNSPLATGEYVGWFYMPTQNGMGVSKISDFIGHWRGRFFSIEAKAPKKEVTGLQRIHLKAINITGGIAAKVSCREEMNDLTVYLTKER